MDVTKIVQGTANYAVAVVTSKVVSDLARKHTDLNEIVIKVGSYAAGATVADYLKPKTDAIVEKSISAIKMRVPRKTRKS